MTSLKTLSDLPLEKQQDTLASATERLLPHPAERDINAQTHLTPQLEEKVINEIRQKLNLKADDASSKAQTKILNYISQALTELLSKDTNVAAVKARLGERGDLPPRDYTINYPKDFANFQNAFAINHGDVAETLRNPVQVQHLTSGHKEIPKTVFPDISFYESTRRDRAGALYSLIVQSIRVKDVQYIYSAWRIYHQDVDAPKIYVPLDLFRVFLSKYGEAVVIEKTARTKLLVYEILPDTYPDPTDTSASGPDDALMTRQTILIGDEETRTTFVTLAYAINVARYCADLVTHGVNVHPERVTQGSFGKHDLLKKFNPK